MKNPSSLPITFQMALAHNEKSFNAFLNMDEATQNNIINEAKERKTVREMNIFVANIPKYVENQGGLC